MQIQENSRKITVAEYEEQTQIHVMFYSGRRDIYFHGFQLLSNIL